MILSLTFKMERERQRQMENFLLANRFYEKIFYIHINNIGKTETLAYIQYLNSY